MGLLDPSVRLYTPRQQSALLPLRKRLVDKVKALHPLLGMPRGQKGIRHVVRVLD